MSKEPENEYMTVSEFAEYAKITKKTAYQKIENNEIPAYRFSQRKILLRKSEIDKYISGRRM